MKVGLRKSHKGLCCIPLIFCESKDNNGGGFLENSFFCHVCVTTLFPLQWINIGVFQVVFDN